MSNSPVSTFMLQMLRASLAAVTVVICSRWLGAAGRGELGLILFWVNLLMIANEYVGGSNLANMMQKHAHDALLPISFIWSFFCVVAGTVLYFSMGGSEKMTISLALLAFPLAILGVQYNMYQGLALVRVRNLLQALLEALKLTFVVAVFWLSKDQQPGVGSVVVSFFWASLLVLLLSSWRLRQPLIQGLSGRSRPPLELFTSGFWSQNGHLVQFLNYRLNLWLLTWLMGSTVPAGIYSNALLLADTIWIFANSFGTIAHMRILKSSNPVFRADITLRYAMIAVAGTVLACLMLAMIPASLYTMLFGPDFSTLKDVILLLIPAMIAVAASSLFSHYLHAVNRFRALFVANLCGLLVQTGLAWWLIPRYGLHGACLSADAGFVFVLIVVYLMFRRQNPGARLHGTLRLKALWKVLGGLISR